MSRTTGFTLIELLVVMVVIGALSAVIIPNLLSAKKAAINTEVQSFARNAATMAEMKRSQNNDQVVYLIPTACAPNLVAELSSGVSACQVRQDSTTTFVLARATSGTYYFFDGQRMAGPLTSLPASW
jgi:type IV pilus assembly protein PilA